ncbi:Inosine-5'-monophosphate dehydrogenase [Nesidiocoris tenuis]|uniref:Inosine-5'-monophosphate dehydrogenase n=1 Tax=Nesidiocoris tenuis TaxID=355587 RepID=A0ABN7ADU6_9HEMI|nr:Inosine-5'-monophosphate dehydrogenase [Nesidiocoris tenuis]
MAERCVGDGLTAAEMCVNGRWVGYNNFSILPGFSDFGVNEVDLTSALSKNIRLKNPFVSSPKDCLTESKMAIALALHGGIGIIHHSCLFKQQASEVAIVKNYTHGFIKDLIVFGPDVSVEKAKSIKDQNDFCGIPITENGELHGKLLGIVTTRDIEKHDATGPIKEATLGHIMTPISKLVTADCTVLLEEARRIMERSRKGKLPIVNEKGEFMAIITRMDLKKSRIFPNASLDDKHRLLVGASVPCDPKNFVRLDMLAKAGVDVIILLSNKREVTLQIEMLKYLKVWYPWIQVIGGDVVTKQQAKLLIKSGVDGLRVGTDYEFPFPIRGREMTPVGRSAGSAVYHVAEYARKFNIPVMADGTIWSIADAIKALAIGADTVMLDSLLSDTNECAEYEVLQSTCDENDIDGITAALDFFFLRDFGHVRFTSAGERIVAKGPVFAYLAYLENGLRKHAQEIGARSLSALHDMMRSGELKFERLF